MPSASGIAYNDPLPENLRELMEQRNITQKQLADYVGVSRQSISQYMDGSAQPVAMKLASIADYFDVTADYLLGRTGAKDKINMVAVDKYGFSEKALEVLEDYHSRQKHNPIIRAINALIEDGKVLEYIAMYLFYEFNGIITGDTVTCELVNRDQTDGDDGGWSVPNSYKPVDVGSILDVWDDPKYKKLFLLEIQDQLQGLLEKFTQAD